MSENSVIREAEGFTIHAQYNESPANTLRWARALAILARVRRRTAANHMEGGSL